MAMSSSPRPTLADDPWRSIAALSFRLNPSSAMASTMRTPGLAPAQQDAADERGLAGVLQAVRDHADQADAQRHGRIPVFVHHPGQILVGDAGHEICQLAETLPASVVVLGTHGRGGIKRAIMGSTSDHVVRHSPCPVLVQGAG